MGDEATTQLVLLRFSGDITIKARATRHQFVRRLVQNLRDAITAQGLPPRVRLSHNRIFVELPAGASLAPLTRVFGIQTLSPVVAHRADDLDAVVRAGVTAWPRISAPSDDHRKPWNTASSSPFMVER